MNLFRWDLSVMHNWVEDSGEFLFIIQSVDTNLLTCLRLTVAEFGDERSVLYLPRSQDIPKSPVHYKCEKFMLS